MFQAAYNFIRNLMWGNPAQEPPVHVEDFLIPHQEPHIWGPYLYPDKNFYGFVLRKRGVESLASGSVLSVQELSNLLLQIAHGISVIPYYKSTIMMTRQVFKMMIFVIEHPGVEYKDLNIQQNFQCEISIGYEQFIWKEMVQILKELVTPVTVNQSYGSIAMERRIARVDTVNIQRIFETMEQENDIQLNENEEEVNFLCNSRLVNIICDLSDFLNNTYPSKYTSSIVPLFENPLPFDARTSRLVALDVENIRRPSACALVNYKGEVLDNFYIVDNFLPVRDESYYSRRFPQTHTKEKFLNAINIYVVHDRLRKTIKPNDIIIGYDIRRDLIALGIKHHLLLDMSLLTHLNKFDNRTSLYDATQRFLPNVPLPIHYPELDANAAMHLLKLTVNQGFHTLDHKILHIGANATSFGQGGAVLQSEAIHAMFQNLGGNVFVERVLNNENAVQRTLERLQHCNVVISELNTLDASNCINLIFSNCPSDTLVIVLNMYKNPHFLNSAFLAVK